MDQEFNDEVNDRLDRIEEDMSSLKKDMRLLLSAIAVRQKDACEIAGVSPDTPRNRHKAGKLKVLSKDGSSAKYIVLTDVAGLKSR